MDLRGEDNTLKANLCGVLFLDAFHDKGDEHVCRAIKAYNEAIPCLSEDDLSLGKFLDDIANGYQARYKTFWLLDDLEKAITTRQNGVVITPEGVANPARRLDSLEILYMRRFERKGNMQDISEAIHVTNMRSNWPQTDMLIYQPGSRTSETHFRTKWKHGGYFRGNEISPTICRIVPRWTS